MTLSFACSTQVLSPPSGTAITGKKTIAPPKMASLICGSDSSSTVSTKQPTGELEATVDQQISSGEFHVDFRDFLAPQHTAN